MMNVAKQTGGLCILFALTLAACDSGDDTTDAGFDSADSTSTGIDSGDATAESDNAAQAQLELVGSWTNNFDGIETITEDTWDNGYSVLSVSSYDNDQNWVVVQSPADDEYTPNQYSKVVWTELEGGVAYYCTVSFGLETREEAEASADNSDASAPLDGGCNGFAWTQITANE